MHYGPDGYFGEINAGYVKKKQPKPHGEKVPLVKLPGDLFLTCRIGR